MNHIEAILMNQFCTIIFSRHAISVSVKLSVKNMTSVSWHTCFLFLPPLSQHEAKRNNDIPVFCVLKQLQIDVWCSWHIIQQLSFHCWRACHGSVNNLKSQWSWKSVRRCFMKSRERSSIVFQKSVRRSKKVFIDHFEKSQSDETPVV